MSSNTLREGLRLTREITTAKASREALRIVRTVLKEFLGPNGLTTAEIFKLASRKLAPSGFVPAPLPRNEVGSPPNIDHPVRSVRYLKKSILPILEGNGVIRMKEITRSPDASTPSSSASASSSALSEKVFAWIPVDPNTLPKPRIPEPPKKFVGTAVGIGEDWSHLNTRRKRARVEKVTRDYAKLKEVLARHGEKMQF